MQQDAILSAEAQISSREVAVSRFESSLVFRVSDAFAVRRPTLAYAPATIGTLYRFSRGGQMLGIRQFVGAFALSLLCLSQVSQAQSPAGILGKDELQKLVVGKTVQWNRASDGLLIAWVINADQSVDATYFRQGTRGRGGRDPGTWELRDSGALCVKMKSDGDRPCLNYFFKKDGTKYFLHRNADQPDAAALGEVTGIN